MNLEYQTPQPTVEANSLEEISTQNGPPKEN